MKNGADCTPHSVQQELNSLRLSAATRSVGGTAVREVASVDVGKPGYGEFLGPLFGMIGWDDESRGLSVVVDTDIYRPILARLEASQDTEEEKRALSKNLLLAMSAAQLVLRSVTDGLSKEDIDGRTVRSEAKQAFFMKELSDLLRDPSYLEAQVLSVVDSSFSPLIDGEEKQSVIADTRKMLVMGRSLIKPEEMGLINMQRLSYGLVRTVTKTEDCRTAVEVPAQVEIEPYGFGVDHVMTMYKNNIAQSIIGLSLDKGFNEIDRELRFYGHVGLGIAFPAARPELKAFQRKVGEIHQSYSIALAMSQMIE